MADEREGKVVTVCDGTFTRGETGGKVEGEGIGVVRQVEVIDDNYLCFANIPLTRDESSWLFPGNNFDRGAMLQKKRSITSFL